MKGKDVRDIAKLKPDELHKQAAELEKKLAAWAQDRYTKQSKNVREAKAMRNRRAVLLTIARQKELVHG